MRRTMNWMGVVAILGLTAAVCNNPTDSVGGGVRPTTGLTGTIRRGPIMPVCQVGVPCDGPMAATFEVRSDSKVVATFQTDSAGHFTVALRPGSYVIVPKTDALMNQQSKPVTVGPQGLTTVELQFDTGIR